MPPPSTPPPAPQNGQSKPVAVFARGAPSSAPRPQRPVLSAPFSAPARTRVKAPVFAPQAVEVADGFAEAEPQVERGPRVGRRRRAAQPHPVPVEGQRP